MIERVPHSEHRCRRGRLRYITAGSIHPLALIVSVFVRLQRSKQAMSSGPPSSLRSLR
jgi:hypothetical protein